ncbi:MAG: OmpA family protein [Myxococcales bacterium]|nr:OmpA family protein [Myxococcales bacterium]
MPRKIMTCLAAALLVLVILTGAQAADPALDVQLFRPSIFGGHFLAIEDAQNMASLCWGLGLYFNYADRPFVFGTDDEDLIDVTNSVFSGNLTLAFAPFSWLALGVDVPGHLTSRGREFTKIDNDLKAGEDTGASDLKNNATLGDIKAELKLVPLDEDKFGIGLALAPYATFPTGNPEVFLGEGTTNFGGRLILEKNLWDVINVAANGGYFYRPERDLLGTKIGSGYLFGAGVSRQIVGGLGFSLEYWGQQYKSSSNDSMQANPMEVTLTLHYLFDVGARLLAGGGPGLGGGAGSPDYRLIAGVDYFPCTAAPAPPPPKPEPTPPPPPPPPPVKTTLTVKVVDKITGELVKNSKITIKAEDKEIASTVLANGQWYNEVQPGKFTIVAGAEGYESVAKNIKVGQGKNRIATVKLREVIVIINNVLFDYDSDIIKPAAFATLDNVASVIQKKAAAGKLKKVAIGGHASSEGTDEYNMNLSKRRAESVKKYLVGKGVDAAMLEAIGYGETKPVADNATEEGRMKNRRVEFVLEE